MFFSTPRKAFWVILFPRSLEAFARGGGGKLGSSGAFSSLRNKITPFSHTHAYPHTNQILCTLGQEFNLFLVLEYEMTPNQHM